MSVLDNALRQIWTHGLKIVEIWKNASPTSSFGAQDIQLDLTRYDLCAVEHSTAIGGDTRFLITDTARLSELGEGYNGALIFGAFCNEGSTTSSAGFSARRSYTKNSSGLHFNIGTRTRDLTTATDNSVCIPFAIYGIQLLGGVLLKIKAVLTAPFRKEVLA